MATKSIRTNGDKVRDLRLRLCLTQQRLAEEADVALRKIVDIEAGRGATPAIIRLVADALGTTFGAIIAEDESAPAAEAKLIGKVTVWLYGDTVSEELQPRFLSVVSLNLPPGARLIFEDLRRGSIKGFFSANEDAIKALIILFLQLTLQQNGIYILEIKTSLRLNDFIYKNMQRLRIIPTFYDSWFYGKPVPIGTSQKITAIPRFHDRMISVTLSPFSDGDHWAFQSELWEVERQAALLLARPRPDSSPAEERDHPEDTDIQ